MKWDCDRKEREKRARRNKAFEKSRQWHKVFAWWPIRIAAGDCRWLEYIERRNRTTSTGPADTEFLFKYCAHHIIWSWEYRALK